MLTGQALLPTETPQFPKIPNKLTLRLYYEIHLKHEFHSLTYIQSVSHPLMCMQAFKKQHSTNLSFFTSMSDVHPFLLCLLRAFKCCTPPLCKVKCVFSSLEALILKSIITNLIINYHFCTSSNIIDCGHHF